MFTVGVLLLSHLFLKITLIFNALGALATVPTAVFRIINSKSSVDGEIVAKTANGTYHQEYGSQLVHSNQAFYDGIWLSPQAAQEHKISFATFTLQHVTDVKGYHPLSNCSVTGIFPVIQLPNLGL